MLRFVASSPAEGPWQSTPKGRLFLQYERRLLQRLLPSLSGYRCVQIGGWARDRCVLETAGTLCQWQLGLEPGADIDVRFDGRHLPLASASVDAIVLCHALERVEQPHALLRECARVLNERGQLVICAFNPLSFWSQRQRITGGAPTLLRTTPPAASRLYDWLRLLEFEPEQLWRYGLGFPLFGGLHHVGRDNRWMRCIAWSAQAYAVVARRYVAPRTPIAQTSRREARAPAVGLARHSSHRVPCRRRMPASKP